MTTSAVDFDPFSEDFFNDPTETYRRMRDEAPVYYNEKYDFFALSRHADVAAAFKDFTTYSSSRGIDLNMVKSGQPPPPMVIMMDPPEHRRMRSLVNKVFTPRAIQSLHAMVDEVIEGFLGDVDPVTFDAVQDFSALFPVEIITRMLGVPANLRQQVRHWIDLSLEREPGNYAILESGIQAGIEAGTMYYNLIRQRRAQPQSDMISDLIATEVSRDDGSLTRLDDIEIAGFASLLGGAGAETVTKLIGNAIVVLGERPELWQTLYHNRGKIPAAVEELLRYEAPAQYVVRFSMREIDLHGVTIPAGKPVFLIAGSANRDPDAFTNADTFDIDRDRGEAQHVGLGYGLHSCLGAALARMECAVALDKLLDFMPCFQVDRDGLSRVEMAGVAGWRNVPVTVLGQGLSRDHCLCSYAENEMCEAMIRARVSRALRSSATRACCARRCAWSKPDANAS